MQIINAPVEITKSGDFKETSFGISQGNEAHILGILRNKLYTNKIYAVVREYATNGLDAHQIANKVNHPLKVKAPNFLSPEFRIRDFGPGLDEDDIRNIYTQYGASTKRNSNEQIGGLGIGSKAAFSYTDSFTIISITELEGIKTKRTYMAYIDESQLGKIALMGSEETLEPTGVEIVIAVKKEDINAFQREILRTFKYFDVKPSIVNMDLNYLPENTGKIEGKDWYFGTTSVVIMGQIGYEINPVLISDKIHSLNDDKKRLIFDLLNYKHLCLKFNIGEVPIAANRESIEYNDQAIKAIVNKINLVVEEIKLKLEEDLKKCPTLLDASLFAKNNSEIFNLLKNETLFYNGHSITSSYWLYNNLKCSYINTSYKRRRNYVNTSFYTITDIVQWDKNNIIKKFKLENYYCYMGLPDIVSKRENIIFYLNDNVKNYQQRISYQLDNTIDKKLAVIINIGLDEKAFKKDFKEFIELWGLKEDDFVKVSSIEIPKVVREGNINPHNRFKCFKLLDVATTGKERSPEKLLESTTIDKSLGGYYLEINRYKVILHKDNKYYTNTSLFHWRNYDNAMSEYLDLDIEPIIIKTSEIATLDSTKWFRYEEFLQEEFNKKNKVFSYTKDDITDSTYRLSNGFIKSMTLIKHQLDNNKMKEFISLLQEISSLKISKEQETIEKILTNYYDIHGAFLTRDNSYRRKLEKLENEVKEKYVLLNHTNFLNYNYEVKDKRLLEEFIKYFNTIG